MVSEHVTRACKILRVIEMMSLSLVLRAAKRGVTRYIFTLNGNDKLGNDWKHLSTSLFEHIEHSLHSEESVWVLLLSNSLEEDRKVMMVVKLLDLDFPENFVLGSMLDGDRKITSVVESSELG
jgi:hypothetical protein